MLKKQLFEHCNSQLMEKRQTILGAIDTVEESMRQEGKSTAGDKHNTARANMQLERERLGSSLQLVEQLFHRLERIDTEATGPPIRIGSLVETTAGRFYLAIPCDAMPYKGKSIYCMGPESPLAKELLGKSPGDAYQINGRSFSVLKVE